jgi:hypothetical protein
MRFIRNASLAAAAAASVLATAASAEPFGPVHMAVNRHQYVGKGCPIEIVFTATINFTMPHPKGFVFNYHWERSDGAKSSQQVVRVPEGERSMVVHERWRLGRPGMTQDVSQTIFLNSGNTHIQESTPTVHVECR